MPAETPNAPPVAGTGDKLAQVAAVRSATADLAAEIANDLDGDWTKEVDDESDGKPSKAAKETEADDDTEETDEDEAEPAAAKLPEGLPENIVDAIKKHDLDALAEALGQDAEKFFKLDANDHKALRHARQRLDREIAKAETKIASMEDGLRAKYGDAVTARKAWDAGDIDSYFDILEKWSGVPHAEVQKSWHKRVQGKNPDDLAARAKLRQLEKEKADREATAEADRKKQADDVELTKAKAWIAEGIKSNALHEYPGIQQLVYEKLRAEWGNGVRKPKAALDLVKKDLQKQAKLYQKYGLLDDGTKATTKKAASVTPIRKGAASSSNGKASRKMTDAELAADVLSSLGREAWRG